MRARAPAATTTTIALLVATVALAVAPISTTLDATYATLRKYAPTLLPVECNPNDPYPCAGAGAALPPDVAATVGEPDVAPCVRLHCVAFATLEAALDDAAAATGDAYTLDYDELTPLGYCAYGPELLDIWDALGAAQDEAITSATPPATVALYAPGGLLRWLPELHAHLACEVPYATAAGTPEQCLRRVCGRRTANPTLGVAAAPYGCRTLVDDPLLPAAGHEVAPGAAATDAFGAVIYTRPAPPWRTAPVLNADADAYNRTAAYGYLAANTYGVSYDPALEPTPCGAAAAPCTWVDPRGLFLPAGRPCLPPAAPIPGLTLAEADVSPTCTLPQCNGAGYCGAANPTALDAACPLAQLYLGDAFEVANDLGPPGPRQGRAHVSPDCLRATPTCARREVVRGTPPPEVAALAAPSLAWAAAILAANPPPSAAYVAGLPLAMPFAVGARAPATPTETLAALAAALDAPTTFPVGALAPAVCALRDPAALHPVGHPCSDLSVDGAYLDAMATALQCVETAAGGDAPVRACRAYHATATLDADGVLVVPPHAGTPLEVEVAVCSYVPRATGDVRPSCVLPPATRPANVSAACALPLCTGEGACAWFAREDGAPCGGGPAAGNLGCVDLRCDKEGACVPIPRPDGTLCSDGDPCTVQDACAAGACVPGPAKFPAAGGYAACVPCASDRDCECTGDGTVGGWCGADGACTEPAALAPTAAVDDPTPPPLQPWEEEQAWARDPPEGPRRCHLQPTPVDPHRGACVRGARGVCLLGGRCGLPTPLLRYAYPPPPPPPPPSANCSNATATNATNATNATGVACGGGDAAPPPPSVEELLAARVPCDASNCTLTHAHGEWFAPPGTLCARAHACAGPRTCVPAPAAPNATGPPPTTCGAPTAPPASAAGTPCTPSPDEVAAAADRCVTAWACDGTPAAACAPAARRTCDPARLFHPTPAALPLPTIGTYGPCAGPAACSPATGECAPVYEREGTLCGDPCAGGPAAAAGTCDGQGTCRRPRPTCPRPASPGALACTVSACSRAGYLAAPPLPELLAPATDVPAAAAGTCAPTPVERSRLAGGSTPCDDQDACTVGDACDGAGTCAHGATPPCPTGRTGCYEHYPCTQALGRCVSHVLPAGTPCDPLATTTASALPHACVVNATCALGGACLGAPAFCPLPTGLVGPGGAPLDVCQLPRVACAGVASSDPPAARPTTVGGGGFVAVALASAPDALVPLFATPEAAAAALYATNATPAVAVLMSLAGALVGTGAPSAACAACAAAGVGCGACAPGETGAPPGTPIDAFAVGACVYTRTVGGEPCDVPGDPCAGAGACVAGACVRTATRACVRPAADAPAASCDATVGECVPGVGCVYPPLPAGTPCDDNDGCTFNDACPGPGAPGPGTCAGVRYGCPPAASSCQVTPPNASCGACAAVDAPDGTPCGPTNASACYRGACVFVAPAPCPEPCGANAACVAGACVCRGRYTGADCDTLAVAVSEERADAAAARRGVWFWAVIIGGGAVLGCCPCCACCCAVLAADEDRDRRDYAAVRADETGEADPATPSPAFEGDG